MKDLAQIIDQLSPDNKQLAEQLVAQLAARDGIIVTDTPLPDPIINVPLWVAWLKGTNKSPRTIDMYVSDVRHYLGLDPRPTSLSIQAYVARRLDEVSAARVNSEQKGLKSFFGYLHAQGLCNTNPCNGMVLVKGAKKEIDCPTNEEIMTIINHRLFRYRDDQKFKMMLMLLLNTGLRIEEAASLQRPNISIKRLEVKVLGKGNKERTIPINAFVAGLLRLYMANNPTTSRYLFPANTKMGYWWQSGFQKALKLACKKEGIRNIHPHQLRHFFATRTLEHGAKLEVISKMLGHASVAITADVYRHVQLGEFHRELEEHDPLKQLGLTPLLTQGSQEPGTIEGEVIDATPEE